MRALSKTQRLPRRAQPFVDVFALERPIREATQHPCSLPCVTGLAGKRGALLDQLETRLAVPGAVCDLAGQTERKRLRPAVVDLACDRKTVGRESARALIVLAVQRRGAEPKQKVPDAAVVID